jgi:hypothetical protein
MIIFSCNIKHTRYDALNPLESNQIMNAKFTHTEVPCLATISLILFAVFSFAGSAGAQTDKTPPQVNLDTKIAPTDKKASQDLGMLDVPKPTPKLSYEADLGGFNHTGTLPWGGVAVTVGADYLHQWGSRGDVQRTSDSYGVNNVQAIVGLGKGWELGVEWQGWNQKDTTIKQRIDDHTDDHTDFRIDESSFTRTTTGNLFPQLMYNVTGNNGGPFGLAVTFLGEASTGDSSGGRDILTGTDTGRRDRTRIIDDYGGGIGLRATYYDLPCETEIGISSSFLLGHPSCCCCCEDSCFYACFDNRISISKGFLDNRLALQATVVTDVSTARNSTLGGRLLAGAVVRPKTWVEFYGGAVWDFQARENNIGAALQMSIHTE